jgi:P27 family predicted phage terminase small subunit
MSVGRRRVIPAGRTALRVAPEPPNGLSPSTAEEWRRAAAILVERRSLTRGDLPTLEFYSMCVAMARQADAEAKALPSLTYTTKTGVTRPHPVLRIAKDFWSDARRFAVELGLTPRSRCFRPPERDGAPGDDGGDDQAGDGQAAPVATAEA